MIKLLNYKTLKILFIIFLTLYSIRSATIAFLESQSNSYDLITTYNSTKLLSKKINHYELYLNNIEKKYSKKNDIKWTEEKDQGGEYSHLFYITFYPFSFTTFEKTKIIWSLFNILLAISLPYLIGRSLKLSNVEIFISITLFLISFPVRSTISLGQNSLFILLFFSIPFIINNKWVAITSGISYSKYSIGYVLFLYYIIKKKYLLYSLIPSVIGWVIYASITNSSLIINLFEPFKLALTKQTTASLESFFSFFKFFNFYLISENLKFIIFFLSVCISFYIVLKIHKKIENNIHKLSLLALVSLTFMPHWSHDYVFLLPLALVSYQYIGTKLGKINFFFITYFIFVEGYLLKILSIIKINFNDISFWSHQYLFYLFFLLILINILLNTEFNSIKKNKNV
jgi:hypothetical protein